MYHFGPLIVYRPRWKLRPSCNRGDRSSVHRHWHDVRGGHERGQLPVATRHSHTLPSPQDQQRGGDRLAGAPENRLVPPHHGATNHRKNTYHMLFEEISSSFFCTHCKLNRFKKRFYFCTWQLNVVLCVLRFQISSV